LLLILGHSVNIILRLIGSFSFVIQSFFTFCLKTDL
jgi:hypothetical protein